LVRGLYTAASGALVAASMADNVANNLANVNGSGFKQTLLQIQSAPTLDVYRIQTDPGQAPHRATPGVPSAPHVGQLGTGAWIYDTPVSFEQGALEQTGNRYDLALAGSGNAFFTIRTPQGIRYTRDGQFTVDAANQLVTMDGSLVLGQTNQPGQNAAQNNQPQPITIFPALGPVTVGADGTVSQAGQTLGRLQLTGFNNLLALRKEGDNNLVDTGNAQPGAPGAGAGIEQGFLEKSNGNVVRSMVDLITAERWFDANERSIKTQDDATNQLISNVAKPIA
jgi:flagellar basal-body rod protein FlgF